MSKNTTEVPENLRIKLAKYLKELKEKRKLGFNQLSIKSEVNPGVLTKILSGSNKRINPYQLKKLAYALKIDYKELYIIVDYLEKDGPIETIPNAKKIETRKVPMYGKASNGSGYLNLNEEVDEEFEIPDEDYKKGRFTIKIEDDSMSGVGNKTIPCGSIALLDPVMCQGIEELIGKVCVFTYNDETYIKQLEIDNQNLIHLVSFNQNISDIIVLNEKKLKCEGRVVNTYWKRKW